MTVAHGQILNTIHRADLVNGNVEAAVEQLFSDPVVDEPDSERRSTAIRYALIETAKCVIANVPQGSDRTLVIKMLRDIRKTCNDAIVFGGGY